MDDGDNVIRFAPRGEDGPSIRERVDEVLEEAKGQYDRVVVIGVVDEGGSEEVVVTAAGAFGGIAGLYEDMVEATKMTAMSGLTEAFESRH